MQTADTIRDANVRYHDLAAEHYDSKWGINYGAVGQAQVTGKLRKALGHEPRRYTRALEIGAGTGYFSLNLLRAGVIGEAVATDISPGMLARLERSAAELELPVETAACEARSCRSTTTRSTWCSATPCSITCPIWTPPSASSGACCARAAWWPSAASRRTTATASPRGRSAAPTRWLRCGGR